MVATAFAATLGVADRSTVFHASLLRAVGCAAYAPENADHFGDDTAFQAVLKRLDPGDGAVFGAQLATFGSWAGPRQPELARHFVAIAPTEGHRAAAARCEVSRALGGRLGLPGAAIDALEDVYERWDGLGIPGRRRGEQLSLVARIVHVAEQAVFAHADGGVAAAIGEVARRAGGHLDPDLAARFVSDADEILAALDAPDLLAAVVDAEPGAGSRADSGDLETLCSSLAIVVDLKGRHLAGHSAHVAAVADAAAGLAGLPAEERATLRAAALLHDLGRAAVSSGVWDSPGPLGAADWERVRLHSYWTERILRRCPGLAPLAEIAAGHHERCDGSGYHRGIRATDLPFAARLLAAADVFAARHRDPGTPAGPHPRRGRRAAACGGRRRTAGRGGMRGRRRGCRAAPSAPGMAGGTHRPRGRRPAAGRPGPLEPGDRRRAVRRRAHRRPPPRARL